MFYSLLYILLSIFEKAILTQLSYPYQAPITISYFSHFLLAMSSNFPHSFIGIVSIPKLKGKSNYEKWRNAIQGFCKMNGYWRYMLGQIPKPALPPKDATPVIQEAFDTKLMKWLTITDSFYRVIQTTCMIDPMLHIGDMELPFDMWKKFESLYQDIGFIERDSIFICLLTQTLSDFADVAEFVDNIKRNST